MQSFLKPSSFLITYLTEKSIGLIDGMSDFEGKLSDGGCIKDSPSAPTGAAER